MLLFNFRPQHRDRFMEGVYSRPIIYPAAFSTESPEVGETTLAKPQRPLDPRRVAIENTSFDHQTIKESINMAQLTIVANIKAEADKIDLLKTELLKLIEPTRAETGCLQYVLHQDNETPAHFMFFEKWQSREAWQTHMNAQHLKDFLASTNGAVVDLAINEMTEVG